MKTNGILRRTLVHPFFSLAFVVALFGILPRLGGTAMMVACALVLSAYVWVLPDHFRSRSGSLRPAVGLVSAMWFMAAVIAVLTLIGELR